MSKNALEWQNVTYSVRQGFWMKPVRIITGFDLSVPKGSVTGLIGPNGAGKTTTIKLGAGLIRGKKGRILINGIPSHRPEARRSVGLLTENQYVYPYLKLDEWLKMLGALSGMTGHGLGNRIRQVLELVDMTEKSGALMHTLSKGQLQRAGIAQALLHEPEILLLDEPMSGLDPFWRYRVQQLLSDYAKQGRTILFSSHIISDVLQLSQRLVVMASGRIKWKGRINDIPQVNQGLRAVIFTCSPDRLKQDITYETLSPRQDGSFVLTLAPGQKKQLYALATSGVIEIESVNPVYSRIEEILYEDVFTTD